MKLISRLLLVFLVIGAFAACDDETMGESFGDPHLNAKFKVDINGRTYYPSTYGVMTRDGKTQIIARRKDGTRINIDFAGSGVGSYALDGSAQGAAKFFVGPGEPYAMEGTDGVINITKYDAVSGLASGTFHFTLYREADEEPLDSLDIEFPDLESFAGTGIPVTSLEDGDGDGDDDDSDIDIDIEFPDLDDIIDYLPGFLEFTDGEFNNIPLYIDGITSNPQDPDDPNESGFYAEIDGVPYEPWMISAVLDSNDELTIFTASTHSDMSISIMSPTLGNFPFSDYGIPGTSMADYDPDSANVDSPWYSQLHENGEIVVTAFDPVAKTISGTITGTLFDATASPQQVQVIGSFDNIEYINENDFDW